MRDHGTFSTVAIDKKRTIAAYITMQGLMSVPHAGLHERSRKLKLTKGFLASCWLGNVMIDTTST
jgi:hypothetical protein